MAGSHASTLIFMVSFFCHFGAENNPLRVDNNAIKNGLNSENTSYTDYRGLVQNGCYMAFRRFLFDANTSPQSSSRAEAPAGNRHYRLGKDGVSSNEVVNCHTHTVGGL